MKFKNHGFTFTVLYFRLAHRMKTIRKIFYKYCLFLFWSLPIPILGQSFEGYVSPLDIPIAVSGTFSEYRKTHFHAGLDMRTNGEKGLNIYSVSGGWVSRIRVSTSGYGKVLYITHDDGYMAVYAHLDKFSDVIQKFVKHHQYAKKQFEVDLYLEKNSIPISVGELIGYSGNTGSSLGPHLHFEIRNPKNVPVNPLKLPYFVGDTIPPVISEIMIYSHLDDGLYRQRLDFEETDFPHKLYWVDSVQVLGPISLGIQMHDRSNLSANVNGVYSVDLIKQDQSIFRYQFDQIQFSDRNYINLMIDYPLYRLENQRIQRLFKHPLNDVSVWEDLTDGIIHIQEKDSVPIKLVIKDHHQNMSVIKMNIIGGPPQNNLTNVYPIHENGISINQSESYQFDFDAIQVEFPKNTFFDDVVLDIQQWNQTIDLGTDSLAVNNSLKISFALNSLQLENKQQFFIAKLRDNEQEPSFISAYKEGNHISTRIKELGTYTILRDQSPPIIEPINIHEGKNMEQEKDIQLRVGDDNGSISSYHGAIDGQWVLFEYESKEDLLIFDFSDIELSTGEHLLEISVEDKVGNQTKTSINFII